MAHDVFISYATRDKVAADAVCARLEEAGIRCWIAPRDVTVGADWASAIVDAIESCRVLVLVFSSESNASPHVAREVELAIRSGAIVAPFRIELVEPHGSLSYFIANAHWLDAVTPPLEAHLTTLVGMLTQLLDGTETEEDAAAERPERRAALTSFGARVRSRPSKGLLIGAGGVVLVVVLALVVAGIALSNDNNSSAGSAVCERGVEWKQAHAPYADGATVATPDDSGAAIIFGGARFNFPDPDEYTALVGDQQPQSVTRKEFDAIGVKPRDGLLVRERTLDYAKPGVLYLAEGGAVFPVRVPGSLAALGMKASDAVTVPTKGLDQAPRIPEAGTLLKVGSSGDVWVISGGVRRVAARVCAGAIVDQLPDDPHILDLIPVAPGAKS